MYAEKDSTDKKSDFNNIHSVGEWFNFSFIIIIIIIIERKTSVERGRYAD